MNHLTEEQLYHLAEVTVNFRIYTQEEYEQMEHLKECGSCYEQFLAMLVLMEATSETGLEMVLQMCRKTQEEKQTAKAGETILGAVRVIREKIGETVTAVMEQVKDLESYFWFEAPIAAATRGVGEEKTTYFKMEDIEDGKTFLVFDYEKNELLIQINTKNLEEKKIRVFIEYENGDKKEIETVKQGKFEKGIVKNIPEVNFEIRIKEERQ